MDPRVLIFSQRQISNLVAYCLAYEFEDTLKAVTDATRVDATNFTSIDWSRRAYKMLRMTSGSRDVARRYTPAPRGRIETGGDCDLFFAAFSHVYELYSLAAIPDWRKRSKKAACFITEVWSNMLPSYLIELLADFDHVFIGFNHSVEDVRRICGRPCTYLPLATDVLRFAPASMDAPRAIEVCNIGRRSPVTHKALIEWSDATQAFYYYDTVAAGGSDKKDRTFRVDNPEEHRRMLATLLKNSQFFFANRSYVNRPDFIVGREEISSRFYEGAAAGTVMIGEAPLSDEFKRQFDWEDAVIHVPFDSPGIGRIIADLNASPTRLRAARHANVREAARRHDWLHRIEAMFDTLAIPHTGKMKARSEKLASLSSLVPA